MTANNDSAIADLRAELQITLRRAGRPPYRQIALLTKNRLSASTISRLFNMKIPPRWDNLVELLAALGVTRNEIRDTWHGRWMRAVDEAEPLAKPDAATGDLLPAGQAPVGITICPKCSAWIADMAEHGNWHRTHQEELLRILAHRVGRMDATGFRSVMR